ncbi:MAG: ATP-binding protein [Planctomycetaceae bacterium]|nr:ATP-binding protein [Planctomycetaceae bacterium]
MVQQLVVPQPLQRALDNFELRADLEKFLNQSAHILRDNKLPFFPDFTDHGIEHVQQVLIDQISLLEPVVCERLLLTSGDAFLIVVGTILHDLGMHLTGDALRHLLQKSGHQRTPGLRFETSEDDFGVDASWKTLWNAFLLEAQRWTPIRRSDALGKVHHWPSKQEWEQLTSEDSVGFAEMAKRYSRITGEFLRRHHARIAYEIAVDGYPGVSGDDFMVLSKLPGCIGELAGFVARSHHYAIRQATRFVNERLGRLRGPYDSRPVVAMSLLRLSDYLQLDSSRAPTILLRTRNPSSPVSVQEWQKHAVFFPVSFVGRENGLLFFGVRAMPTYGIFVACKRLLQGLQMELDECHATLREQHPKSDRSPDVWLSFSRVESDLSMPAFVRALPYEADENYISVDPQILYQLVQPLYGSRPEFGVRELLQNAIDAVRERNHVDVDGARHLSEEGCPRVIVEFTKRKDEDWEITVKDTGVGMTPRTIRQFFLRAGASFRHSQEWSQRYNRSDGTSAVLRTGQFGIGVFAGFLLGPKLEVTTRHYSESTAKQFTFTQDSSLIELRKLADDYMDVGTSIRITILPDVAGLLELDAPVTNKRLGWDWFVGTDILVERRVTRDGVTHEIPSERDAGDCWRSVEGPEGFGILRWSPKPLRAEVGINGIRIGDVITNPANIETHGCASLIQNALLQWPLVDTCHVLSLPPAVHFEDPNTLISLAMDRKSLAGELPKIVADRICEDVELDFVAFCLAFAPSRTPQREPRAYFNYYPLATNKKWFFLQPETSISNVNSHLMSWASLGSSVFPYLPGIVQQMSPKFVAWFGAGKQSDTEVPAKLPPALGPRRTLFCAVRDSAAVFDIKLKRMGHQLPTWNFGQEKKSHLPFACHLVWQLARGESPEFGELVDGFVIVSGLPERFMQTLQTMGVSLDSLVVRVRQQTLIVESRRGVIRKMGFQQVVDDMTRITRAELFEAGLDSEPACPIFGALRPKGSAAAQSVQIHDRTSELWIEAVGTQGLPLDSRKRADIMKRIATNHPKLHSYYEQWMVTKNKANQ